MRVLNLSLDQKILDKDSDVAKRAVSYGKHLDKYFIIVPGKNISLDLSSNTNVLGISGKNKFHTLLKIFQFLDKHLKENKYDLITIQDVYYLASIGTNLASKYSLKVELQVHGFEKMTMFRRSMAKSNLQKADKIRAVSQRLKNEIVKNFNISEEKIYLAPVAVDKDKIVNSSIGANLKEKYPNDFIFLTVGRLVAVKNIAMQIRALANLGPNTRLIIVGDGPEKASLSQLAQDLKLEDKVNFMGWTDDVSGYYQSADCLLLSSDSEGYGLVVAEAVLSKLPIIMTDVGVAGELVEDNVNGLIIPVGHQKAFTDAMNKVVNYKTLLQKFATNTILYKDKILTREELVDNIINNWKNIINV